MQTHFRVFEANDANDLDDAIGEWLDENEDIKIISHSQSEYGEDVGYTITMTVFYQFEKGA